MIPLLLIKALQLRIVCLLLLVVLFVGVFISFGFLSGAFFRLDFIVGPDGGETSVDHRQSLVVEAAIVAQLQEVRMEHGELVGVALRLENHLPHQ